MPFNASVECMTSESAEFPRISVSRQCSRQVHFISVEDLVTSKGSPRLELRFTQLLVLHCQVHTSRRGQVVAVCIYRFPAANWVLLPLQHCTIKHVTWMVNTFWKIEIFSSSLTRERWHNRNRPQMTHLIERWTGADCSRLIISHDIHVIICYAMPHLKYLHMHHSYAYAYMHACMSASQRPGSVSARNFVIQNN